MNILLLKSEQTKTLYIIILLLIFLPGCADKADDPKKQIRTVIDKLELAVEKRSVALFKEHISVDYKDKRHSDRQRAIGSLFRYFQRNKNINLFTRIRNIEINEKNPEHAIASVNVAMTGTQVDSTEKLLTLKADVFRFDIDLENTDDQWLITGAEWKRIDVKAFLD